MEVLRLARVSWLAWSPGPDGERRWLCDVEANVPLFGVPGRTGGPLLGLQTHGDLFTWSEGLLRDKAHAGSRVVRDQLPLVLATARASHRNSWRLCHFHAADADLSLG